MADSLTETKRKFIERWRKSVGHYIRNGGLCKVTVPDIQPERKENVRPYSDRSRSMASVDTFDHFPSIRNTEIWSDSKVQKTIHEGNSDKIRLRLPPSPTGMLVQNGSDVNKSWLLHNLHKTEVRIAPNLKRSDADHTKEFREIGRQSSKIAKEIFDKYNMKSESQNMLPGKHVYNGFQQYSMPWRNKTFLTLPIRFNGNIKMKNAKYLDTDQVSVSSRNVDFESDVTVVSSGFDDWAGGE